MLYLDRPIRRLMVTLAGAVATNQWDITAQFFDQTPQSTTTERRGGTQKSNSNNTTDVSIVDAVALQGRIRNIHTLTFHNRDTASSTITVKYDDSGTQTILIKQTVAAGESLTYEDAQGWNVLSPITAPFVDTTPLVRGSLDSTKLLRIEVDGLTTGTTRTWTAADADIVVSGSAAAMTAGRVVYTTTGGLLLSDANALYNGTNLTLTPSGTFTLAPVTLGNIDNTRIGFSTRAALQATSGDFSTTLAVGTTSTLTGNVQVGSVAVQAATILSAVNAGNCVEFGHSNTAGYRSHLGADNNSGKPWLAFHAELGTTLDTYRTRGIKGSVLRSDLAGGWAFTSITSANADNQAGTDVFTISTTGATTVGGNLTVSGVGPHAIGGATNVSVSLIKAGTFTTGGTSAWSILDNTTLVPLASGDAFGWDVGVTLNKAGSGTHTDFAAMRVQVPNIGAGAATLTNATTLKIAGAPSVGTNQRALWVAAGVTQLDGATTLGAALTYGGVTFANTTTGSGSLVGSASPTFTGTVNVAALTASGTVTPQGLLDISGASAGQISFPAAQNASAGANVLDDYEEGTWTPSLGGSTTYTTQSGTYTKIGRKVFFTCVLQVNAIGTGSTTTISGLPFTSAQNTGVSVGNFGSAAANFVSVYAQVQSATIVVYSQTAASAANAGNAFFGTATQINISGSYSV